MGVTFVVHLSCLLPMQSLAAVPFVKDIGVPSFYSLSRSVQYLLCMHIFRAKISVSFCGVVIELQSNLATQNLDMVSARIMKIIFFNERVFSV